ncbi:MAG: hypothetical protein AAF191_16560, partial [Verrucomicrobiota bacterium]
MPSHNDKMVVGDGDERLAEAKRTQMNEADFDRYGTPEGEHGLPWALENLQGSVEKGMDKLCANCCEEVEFILHIDSWGDNSDLQDGIDRYAPSW